MHMIKWILGCVNQINPQIFGGIKEPIQKCLVFTQVYNDVLVILTASPIQTDK